MAPSGQSATRKSCRSGTTRKHADFSATRCFTIAIDGASIDKAAAVEDDCDTTSSASNSNSRSTDEQTTPRELTTLSSSRTSSLNSLTSGDSTVLSPVAPRAFDSTATAGSVKRQVFWRNVVRQFNFTDAHERSLLISLTHGIAWMKMAALPRAFIERHREIFYLISTPEYQRSSSIQRDVTRTFSIFERTYLRERDIGAQQGALYRVLNAIAEAEDGYCQGMNFIAALFLVEGLDEADAYALFLYLLKKRHLARIYQRSSTFLDDYLEHFDLMIQRELPDLHQHMRAQGFVLPMFGIEWFTTLFSLSTKPDLACAIFDLFFVGVQDIFLRVGLAILKLLESKLMCMSFEDFLKEFKPLVRELDPYQVVLKALSFCANPLVRDEDTAVHISRAHFVLSTHQNEASGQPAPPKTFDRHRTLPPQLAGAIVSGNFAHVQQYWHALVSCRPCPMHCTVLANEILHYATWYGRPSLAYFAIARCGADVNNVDDTDLTPLHFGVIRNQPDVIRLLLTFGADEHVVGGRWNGSADGLTPLETAQNWRFRDTTAAQLVLEREVCLYCNAKIDKLAFGKATCPACVFPFCDRPFADCIAKHQCPRARRRARSDGHDDRQADQDDDNDDDEDERSGDVHCRFRNSSGALTATTGASSRRSSWSPSEALLLPALESVKSCVDGGERCTGVDNNDRHSDHARELKPHELILQPLAGLFSSPSLACDGSSSSSNQSTERVQVALEFPDRPEWYCNAPLCHAVFAFFSNGLECAICGGFFCADDFHASTKRCRRCDRTR